MLAPASASAMAVSAAVGWRLTGRARRRASTLRESRPDEIAPPLVVTVRRYRSAAPGSSAARRIGVYRRAELPRLDNPTCDRGTNRRATDDKGVTVPQSFRHTRTQ